MEMLTVLPKSLASTHIQQNTKCEYYKFTYFEQLILTMQLLANMSNFQDYVLSHTYLHTHYHLNTLLDNQLEQG